MRAILVGAILLLGACAPTSEDEGGGVDPAPFTYSVFQDTPFDIHVLDGSNAPLAGVSVSVQSVFVANLDLESEEVVEVHATGLTDAGGRLFGSLRLPSDVTSVDVVVDDEDKTGPWTDAALKATQGFFAPSSRQTLSVESGSLIVTIVLEDA